MLSVPEFYAIHENLSDKNSQRNRQRERVFFGAMAVLVIGTVFWGQGSKGGTIVPAIEQNLFACRLLDPGGRFDPR